MPKKAPDNVIEHRLTFGNIERDAINEFKQNQKINFGIKSTLAIGGLAAGVGLGYLAYSVVKYLGVGDIVSDVKNNIEDFAVNAGDDIIETFNSITGSNIKTSQDVADSISRQEMLFNKQEERIQSKYDAQLALYQAQLATPNLPPSQEAAIRRSIAKLNLEYTKAMQALANKRALYAQSISNQTNQLR